jgi:hypothetical protein
MNTAPITSLTTSMSALASFAVAFLPATAFPVAQRRRVLLTYKLTRCQVKGKDEANIPVLVDSMREMERIHKVDMNS